MIKTMNAFDKSVKNASLTYFSNFDNKTDTLCLKSFENLIDFLKNNPQKSCKFT